LKRGRVAAGSSFESKDSRRGVGDGGVNISILAVRGRVAGDDDDEDVVSLRMGDKFLLGLLGGNCEGGTASATAACDDDDDDSQDAF
jgi:hypothetical protein